MANEVGPIIAQLVGGPMDGDSFVMNANMSIAPPAQLAYLSVGKDEAGEFPAWETYEGNLGAVSWEPHPQEIKYHFTGHKPALSSDAGRVDLRDRATTESERQGSE